MGNAEYMGRVVSTQSTFFFFFFHFSKMKVLLFVFALTAISVSQNVGQWETSCSSDSDCSLQEFQDFNCCYQECGFYDYADDSITAVNYQWWLKQHDACSIDCGPPAMCPMVMPLNYDRFIATCYEQTCVKTEIQYSIYAQDDDDFVLGTSIKRNDDDATYEVDDDGDRSSASKTVIATALVIVALLF